MNEWVLAEFMVEPGELNLLMQKLNALGEDFCKTKSSHALCDLESDHVHMTPYIVISGKINSNAASIIKLQDPFLAEHMRVSYISNDLKDKYRR